MNTAKETSDSVRTLMIEDDPLLARAWGMALRQAGIEVDHAASLSEAKKCIAAIHDRPYQVVLVDLHLPDGDGSDLLDSIGKITPTPAVAVVSGHMNADSIVDFYRRCSVALPKPIGRRALISLVYTLAREGGLEGIVSRFARDHRLSSREKEIVMTAALGMDVRSAAKKLGCAETTVPTFWKRVYEKTGVHGQKEVVAALLRYSLESSSR